MQKEFKLLYVNDYPLIEIEGRVFLLDTGYPCSVAFVNDVTNVLGIRLALNPQAITKQGQIISFGRYIDGIIGKDVFSQFDNMIINIKEGKVYFNGEIPQNGNKCNINGNYQFEAKINGKSMPAYFDTGAHCVMFKNIYFESSNKIRRVTEPIVNTIVEMDEYEVDFSFNGNVTKVRALDISSYQYPNLIFFGTSAIAKEFVSIDFKNKLLIYR